MTGFQKATKRQSFLRLALEGPAGYGKTYTALQVATKLAPGKVAYVDTEAGSASKYADLFDFDVIELHPPFHPQRAVDSIAAAEEGGYGVVVLDSLSHFWTGEGGLLELVDQIARTKYRNDSHRAWADAGAIQQALIDAILRSKLHVIAAMRTKKDYVREEIEKDGRTQTRIRAAGTKTIQRDDFDYEFDIIGRFDVPAVMAIVKSRCAALPPETMIEKPGAELAATLEAWLAAGESFADQEKTRVAAEKAAAKEEEKAEKARLAECASLEATLTTLIGKYKKLVADYDDAPAFALIEKHRADTDFTGWLGKQIETFSKNIDAKKPSEFKAPAGVAA